MKKISICIPTFNRERSIQNCLNSIISNSDIDWNEVEVCVSDNSTNDRTKQVVLEAKKKININYHKNSKNIGRVKNYLNVVSIATGEYIWLIGDDDLLLPSSLTNILSLINKFSSKIDFFYINSFILDSNYIFSFPQPFDTKNLPNKMNRFSLKKISEELNFIDLINPKVSFDFLGGMYLAVFKKRNWDLNVHCLKGEELESEKTFSTFGNTFPHLKIFANSFSNSKAYFCSQPLSVTLSGVREWEAMYPLIRSIRLIEALDEFKKNGLRTFEYIIYKNYALSYFAQDLIKMLLYRESSGWEYLNFKNHIIKNMLYPNFYLSFFYFFLRKLKFID